MRKRSKAMKRYDLLRYGLWALMAQTAYANRQHYRMMTTWLPHFLTNTLALLLPDAVRRIFPPRHQPRNIVEDTLITMVANNPAYAVYVAPLSIGYIVSHPRFNIYKGDMAKIRVAWFGLDAIPHSATAFALAALIVDTLDTMGERTQYSGLLADLAQWGNRNPSLVTLGILAAVTAVWEYGEYDIHNREMGLKGSAEAINMQWSVEDTRNDVITNLAGCLAALAWHAIKKRRGDMP